MAVSPKKIAFVASGVILAGVIAFLLAFAVRSSFRRKDEALSANRTLRAGWRDANFASLMNLSAVKNLSVGELKRFNQAADDPAQMREALIEIHEARLANSSRDLQDAQRRRRELEGTSGYPVYGDQPPSPDYVELVNEDERAATAQIALYASALSRIRAWQPLTFESYVASRPAGSGPPIAGRLPSSATVARTPDAPSRTVSDAGLREPDSTAAESGPAVPSEADLANASRHPSVTVYADEEQQQRRPAPASTTEAPGPAAVSPVESSAEGTAAPDSAAVPAATANLASRERAEQEIRKTLGRWSAAMVLNNPHAEAVEYAPHLDRYFLRKNVDKAFVEADKADYLRRGNLTAGFTLQDVTIENETDNTADVRLTKDVTWQRGGEGQTHILIRSRLQLQRIGGQWKITGEQDFR